MRTRLVHLLALGALVAVLAAALGGCGGDDDVGNGDDDAARDYEIADLIQAPPNTGEQVVISGEVTPVGNAGFVLGNVDAAIFVGTGPGEGVDLELGQRAQVIGTLRRLSEDQAQAIATARRARDDDFFIETRTPGEARARVDRGSPFIDAERIEPLGG